MTTVVSSRREQAHHIDSLDGIRGIAIFMVLSMRGSWFGNGWIGVDLFFVLSGCLITGILRRTRREPFYWRRFYIKRNPHPSSVASRDRGNRTSLAASFSGRVAGYALSLGNIVEMTRFGIWPLGHLWPLSVEEHYYLLWPFFVLRLPRRQLQ
jgi:peptidoglycan/LPS O-acetylase OafA/YrhL